MDENERSVSPGSPLSPEMTKALALVADGHSYRYAAQVTGIPHTTIWEHGLRCGGLNAFGQEDLATIRAEIALARREATLQLGEALRDGRIKESQLPVTTGILTDKALRILELEKRIGHDSNVIDRIAEAIDRIGGRMKATFTLEPKKPEDEAIDVTDQCRRGRGGV